MKKLLLTLTLFFCQANSVEFGITCTVEHVTNNGTSSEKKITIDFKDGIQFRGLVHVQRSGTFTHHRFEHSELSGPDFCIEQSKYNRRIKSSTGGSVPPVYEDLFNYLINPLLKHSKLNTIVILNKTH